MSILQLSIPTQNLSLSSKSHFSQCPLIPLFPKSISFSPSRKTLLPPIRMGGGPRTFPGGVSKWQWKRMQANKAKQLLKARLARERQVYEMRKRAELKAAVADLERPWETVRESAPKLFSVSADEQLKVLADRFQRPGGFDMWSERDGPQLFSPVDGLPSARFFPKGVVHSTKPYGKIDENFDGAQKLSLPGSFSEVEDDVQTNGYKNSSTDGQVKADRWTENTVSYEKKATDSKFKNKPYKQFMGKSNVGEKLSLPSVVTNGYKNSRDGNGMIDSDGKFGNKPYQKIGKKLDAAEDGFSRNGYKISDRFRGGLSGEGQLKDNKWMENSMDGNQRVGSNGKFRNKSFGKFGGNANGAENVSLSSAFSEFENRVERNGDKRPDRFIDGLNRERWSDTIKSAQNSSNRNVKSYSHDKLGNKGNTRRFEDEKSNASLKSSGLSTEVYDMNLRDDGRYEFES